MCLRLVLFLQRDIPSTSMQAQVATKNVQIDSRRLLVTNYQGRRFVPLPSALYPLRGEAHRFSLTSSSRPCSLFQAALSGLNISCLYFQFYVITQLAGAVCCHCPETQ